MRVITAPDMYIPKENDICCFLAGGITNCPNWQKEVIDDLNDRCDLSEDNIILFNPRRENFPIGDKSAAYKQIEWEYDQLERMDIFSMYFSSGDSDQPICMYELGRNILRMQMRFPTDWEKRIIITADENYRRYQDVIIQTELATKNKIFVYDNIYDHCSCINRAFNHIKYHI